MYLFINRIKVMLASTVCHFRKKSLRHYHIAQRAVACSGFKNRSRSSSNISGQGTVYIAAEVQSRTVAELEACRRGSVGVVSGSNILKTEACMSL